MPYAFPLVAVLAPVLASGLFFALTRSPFALVFAVLGPVIALASLADSALQRRRRARSESRRFAADIAEALAVIDASHAHERAEADAAHPGIRALLACQDDDGLWPTDQRSPVLVTLGRGTVASTLEVDGRRPPVGERDLATRAQLDGILQLASRLADAPVVLDARLGIGVCGPRAAAQAAARACALQVARAVSPALWDVRFDESSIWADALPHRRDGSRDPAHRGPPDDRARRRRGQRPPVERVEFVRREEGTAVGDPVGLITVAVAGRAVDLPRECRVIVHVGSGATATYSRRGSSGSSSEVRLDYAAAHEAAAYARGLLARAELEGLVVDSGLPDEVRLVFAGAPPTPLQDLASAHAPPRPTSPSTDTLRCAVGRSEAGVWNVDLVAEGPHAVIGGTTGSGKSELLISWVLAMAAAYPPTLVTFLLVDFKGGASFTAITSLPHSVGVITDLDPSAANRALTSLRAEVLFRERALSCAGARSIEERPDLHALARLVIVVDEFAALGAEFPELHQLFADLASRGRSLGIHLILCTQRPADALRETILANCTLRISLRLNSRADSVAVIGTGAAAELSRHPRGRALATVVGEEPRLVQVAISGTFDTERVLARWPAAPPARRPWCDPLPRMVPFGELPLGELPISELRSTDDPPAENPPVDGPGFDDPSAEALPVAIRVGTPLPAGLPFGLLDLPREQRRALAVYRPREHGNLLVCGGRGSGKSTAIRAIGSRVPHSLLSLLPSDAEGAWDELSRIAASLTHDSAHGAPRDGASRLLVVDDLDSLVARYAPEHQFAFVELMAGVLRDGPQRGTATVLAAQRVSSTLSGIAALCETRLLLRLPGRQDHVLLGGRGEQYDDRMPPGGGVWLGNRVQVGFVPAQVTAATALPSAIALPPGGWTAVVSPAPGGFAARLPPGGIRIMHPAAIDPLEIARMVGPVEPGPHTLIVGDPSAWQGAWALLARVRGTIPIAFDSCAVGEVRAVTGSRVLPPPLAARSRSLLVLSPSGDFVRASVPERQGGLSRESAQNNADWR